MLDIFTDKIKKGKVKVAYCPTGKMLADFYKTTSGCTILKDSRCDSQSILQQKCRSPREWLKVSKKIQEERIKNIQTMKDKNEKP